jgi:hypothetical protein
LKNVKFPLLYVAEILLFIPLLASFVGVNAFLGARGLDTLDLHGKSLPVSWEAAISNHGKFLPGYLIANHPLVFVSFVLLLIGSAFALHQVRKVQALQRKEASANTVAHRVAQGIVFGVWAITVYVLVMYVLVGVSPA